MRKLAISLGILLCSCSQNESSKDIAPKNAMSVRYEDSLTQKKEIAIDTGFKVNDKETPYKGDLVESAKWEDKRGKNILLISTSDLDKVKEERRKYCNKVDIYAYHYVFDANSNKWAIYWSLHDFDSGDYDVSLNYQPKSLFIGDINEDGKAESYFVYHFNYVPELFYETKLILHVDSIKLKVEGSTGKDREMMYREEDPSRLKEYYYGKLFQDSLYKNWAQNAWIKCSNLQLHYDSLKLAQRTMEHEQK